MKILWSAFFSLLLLFTLVSCGEQQFGIVPKNESTNMDPLAQYMDVSQSTFTPIKPKVDVIYFVDNSGSSYYLPNDIKFSLQQTVNYLSQSFDYRVIGAPLLPQIPGSTDYTDFQVMTNSTDLSGIPGDGRRISSYQQFDFFTKEPISGVEKGLRRLVDFVDYHKNNLLRNNSHLIIVLISNGRDTEVERDDLGTGQTSINQALYDQHLNKLKVNLKNSMNYIQLRLLSLTALSQCRAGYWTARKSYVKASQDLYVHSQATDNPVFMDSYDLCSSNAISSIFNAINNSIKEVILHHEYKYAPITFAEDNELVSLADLQVKKVSADGTVTNLVRDVNWKYVDKGSKQSVNLRSGPNPIPGPGEPHMGRLFVEFLQPIVHPEYVVITSVSKMEYFGYVVLPQRPRSLDDVSVRINGAKLPRTALLEISDHITRNIKVVKDSNPPQPDTPVVIRTGYMIRLAPEYYYKSGDKVEVSFTPAGV